MRIIGQKLNSACDAIIEVLESRLLLSAGLLASDQDIGSPAQAGSSAYSNGVYTVVGGGSGVGGNSDQFNFAYETFAGNGTLIANVNSLSDTNSAAEAGIMFRNDSSASSAFAGIFVTATNGVTFVARASDGSTASQSTTVGIHASEYLELTLSGSTVTGYYSSNGTAWTQFGSIQTVTLGSSALVGLGVASANSSETTTATFSDVSVLSTGWSDNDVGSPPLPGSAGYNSAANIFSVTGSGTGIGSSSDQFNFTNYAMTGDGTVVALVDSLTNTNSSAQAGVMIRADTTAGALFAGASISPQDLVTFNWRSASGSVSSSSATVSGPGWLELTDQGNEFSAYYSSDDVHWTQVGTTEAIAMPSATVLAGLWVSSNNSSAQNTAAFSDVSLFEGGWTDNDIGSPAIGGSADYDAPSDTNTISGNGSDIWGMADQFNFASTTMTGNGSVLTYVDSITNTNAWAKAGVMIRNDITAGSAFAAVLVSPTNGITFEWRTTAGGSANQEISSPAGGPTPAPVGLELTRSGNSFTAYYSTDGITWIQVGPSQTVALNTTALAGLAVTSHNTGALCTAAFSSTGIGSSPAPGAGIYSAADQLFLNDLEDREVMSFWDETNPNTGLTPDNSSANGGSPSADSSIAAIGFDLTALTIGDARGWLSHANAYQRALTTIDFLYNSGANVNGFFYHFLNETTGARYGTSEVSSVDTAELMAGVLDAAQYWAGTPLQTVAIEMYDRVDWSWMQQSSGVFYGAWTPESGFSGGYGDFSEAVILYLLGLGSPTYPISQSSWNAWSRSPTESYDGYTFVEADDAALFTEQYPQAWFNLQGLTDSHGLNYYQNSQTATLAQRQFMINLSSTYSDYGPNMWGLTPSEGINGYTVWGGPPANGPIDGTVVPTAPGGSLEFEPRLSIDVLENMKQTYGSRVYQKYGLVDAFNPLSGWTSSLVLGIDVGMTLVSAENSRSNLVWNTFSQSSAAQQAIARAFPSKTGPAEWAADTSGNWNLSTNWSTETVPNSAGAEADFLEGAPPVQTVYTNAGITVGTLQFNSAAEYVIAGAATLTLQGSGSSNAVVDVDQGTAELDLPITLASNTTFDVAAGATLIIANPMTIDSGATLTTTGGGTVTYESIVNVGSGASVAFDDSTYAEQLSLAAGASATVGGTGSVLEVASLSNSGTLNLGSNTLLIDYGTSADPIASVKALLASGYSGGAWSGTGINSSAAAANSAYGLGYADGADGVVAGLASGQIEIKYTLYGDANLDGTVNSIDFGIMAANFGKSVNSWDHGDFNYDGVVSSIDFGLLSANFGKQSSAAPVVLPISTPAVVPVTLTPSTVTPLTSVGTVLPKYSAASSPAITSTDQGQNQSYVAPTDAVLNPDDKESHTKSRSSHRPGV
ncbi:MAG TPA: glucoamylase family protein [Tepidisphaeraceae bacterium]|nr:glucoamylase family protein [Tepidisphaeraceae bacterium]